MSNYSPGLRTKLHIECLSIAIVPDGGANCQTDGGMRHLQLDLSTLNRRLAALERNLSTKLFDRGVAGDTLMSHDGRLLKLGKRCIVLNDLTHFIDGKPIKGASSRFSDVFTPMTGEISARVPLASATEVRAAVENAKAAQPAWAATNPQQRARVLMKFVGLLNRDLNNLAVPLAYYTFGGWKRSAFGDLNQHGPDSIRFLHEDQDGNIMMAFGATFNFQPFPRQPRQ